MAQLNIFSGGLNTRLASHLLNMNEGVVYENIDPTSNILSPIKSDLDKGIVVDKSIYYFKDNLITTNEDRDYVEFQEKLYYSNGGIVKKSTDGVTWNTLGIQKPSTKPAVTKASTDAKINAEGIEAPKSTVSLVVTGTGGDFPASNYRYKVLLKDTATGAYTIKSLSTSTTGSTSQIEVKLDTYQGLADTMVVYRLYEGDYRLVSSTTGLSVVDTAADISANAIMPDIYDFLTIETYKVLLTNTSTGKKYIKELTIYFSGTQDTYGVKFFPISGYTFEVFKSNRKVTLVSYGGHYYDIGNTTDTKIDTLPNGTYQYCYTYYNVNDGTESQPSPYSNELLIDNCEVTVSVFPSSDTQVTNIKLYRLGGAVASMSLVVTLTNTSQTYVDKLGDLQIEADILDSYNNAPPPSGLKYLSQVNAMFFGAVKDKLYFSDIAYVDYWSPFNFIDFDDTITGIGEAQNGLLVFTKFKTYIITGNSPDTLSKFLLSGNQGCLLHKSIKYMANTLLWLSSDGICASAGGDIQVMTRDKLGKVVLTNPKYGIAYDDIYYLTHDNGTLVVDIRFGPVIRTMTNKYDSFNIYQDTLYASKDGRLVIVEGGTGRETLRFKSPKLIENSITNLKNYKNLYVRSTGNLTIKTYIDEKLLSTKVLDAGTEEIKLPQQERLGYGIQFEVEGTGDLLELELKVEGRQNGR